MDNNRFDGQDEDLVIDAILLDDDDIEIEIDITNIDIYEHEIVHDNVIPLRQPAEMEETRSIGVGNPSSKWPETKWLNGILSFFSSIKSKYKNKDLTKRQKLFLLAVSALTILTTLGLTLESPLFDVEKVELNNSSQTELSESELVQINEIINSRKGEPIYRSDVKEAQDALQDMPGLKNVSIDKDWPSTLIFNFERRTPYAYIVTDKGIVLIDDEGMIFAKAQEQPQGIVAFEGLSEVSLYEVLEDKDFLEIMKAMPQEIRNQVVQVKLFEDRTFNAVLSDGITIKIGKAEELDRKLAIAWSIILAKGRSELGYIDVSVPNLPVSGSPELKV